MRILVLTIVFVALLSSYNHSNIIEIDLSGAWQVKLDSTNIGVKENWANTKFEGNQINLPGTLDDAGLGKPNSLKPEINNYVMSNLSIKLQYVGKAWYQKEINIPNDWKDNIIMLSLERVLWESTVYIDGQKIGSSNSLIGSHDFELKNLSPGKHFLTIAIDNSNKFPDINVAGSKYPDPINQYMAHAYTNHTQIKWNGILGNISLKPLSKEKPTNIQVYPTEDLKRLRITFEQSPTEEDPVELTIKSIDGNTIYNARIKATKTEGDQYSLETDRPDSIELWDEFNPTLYDVSISTSKGKATTRFGYKFIGNNSGNLTLNGTRIFLRGNLECAIFPLTGHPPMVKEEWAKLIGQAKVYGLNHLRFHSCCPPKAAFEAADEAGFYFQVELPHWSLKVGEDIETVNFLKSEMFKIIKDCGNHPSFFLMAMGNELRGDMTQLNDWVAELKSIDNRHLYTTTAFSFQRPSGLRPEPEDEFFIAQYTNENWAPGEGVTWIRGQGVFNAKPPHFNADFTEGASFIKVPLISHEIGQYAVYPDMSEIEKYTGVLEPLNFIAIKNDLEKKGLVELATYFTHNSGKLAAILYKEEIERALKTPNFDGFQLLQLQDFPGQGTALVGLLNAFWESKGVISAEEFSSFNSELVPLLRFEKAVYQSGETFEALIEVANFFKPFKEKKINWKISDEDGNVLTSSTVTVENLAIGNTINLGKIQFNLETEIAKKLKIELLVDDTKYRNYWDIWVFPKNVAIVSNEITVTSLMVVAEQALTQGKKVLLNPDYNKLKGIEDRFVPVFWSPVHFPNQPATMGISIDAEYPVFDEFPTDTHTNWQWWDLCINSKSLIVDSLDVKPLVRVIDNFVTNHNLASVFEAKVGEGSLLFSAIDIISDLDNRPAARQFRHSLLKYMESDAFAPSNGITIKDLESLILNGKQNEFSTEYIYD